MVGRRRDWLRVQKLKKPSGEDVLEVSNIGQLSGRWDIV